MNVFINELADYTKHRFKGMDSRRVRWYQSSRWNEAGRTWIGEIKKGGGTHGPAAGINGYTLTAMAN
ncbi:MAG: hypothetical protein KJZ77_10390 [Anaerolineales bacterium]|nr:hypothetical protein [Anaerolineales bacterium]